MSDAYGLKCPHCQHTQTLAESVITEGARLTCVVCGTNYEINAKVLEPVQKAGAGEAPLPTLPPAPPSPAPAPAPAGGPDAVPMAASWTDDQLASILTEVDEGMEPWLAYRKLFPPKQEGNIHADGLTISFDPALDGFVVMGPDQVPMQVTEDKIREAYGDRADKIISETKEAAEITPPE